MSKRLKTTQIVLFLGAGSSAAFGYPITSQIFPRIREGLLSRTLFPLESNPKRERAKMNRLEQYLNKLLPTFFDEEVELPLITDVLSLVDLLLSTREIAVPMFSLKEMEDFRTLLEQAIIETINKKSNHPRSNKSLDLLTDWILNISDSGKALLTIVSTNYDSLVDSLLLEKIEMDSDMSINGVVDFGFSWREHGPGKFLEMVNHPPKSPRLRIFKLHGSINWLKCPLCGFIYVNTTGGGIFEQAFREDKIDYNNTCVCGHGPVRTVIVAPSMVRSIQDPDLLTIWRSALESLRTADEWIIAGYSFPPEDIAIRSILLRAYHGRGRKGQPPKIRVVQREKDQKMEGRYRLLFPECLFEYGGFEKFIESLPKPHKHYPTF